MRTEQSKSIVEAAFSIFEPPVTITSVNVADIALGNIPQTLKLTGVSRKRQLEYAAGRFAARNAIESSGHNADYPSVGAARQPIWPEGLVGSISHTDELAVAVVAPTEKFDGVGIDIEPLQVIELSTAAQFLTERELDALSGDPDTPSAHALLTAFSYKESIYKCIQPILGEYLDFLDVELTYNADRIAASCVDVIHPAAGLVRSTIGNSRIVDNHVVSACWLRST